MLLGRVRNFVYVLECTYASVLRKVCWINQVLFHFVLTGRTLNLLFAQSNCREKPGKCGILTQFCIYTVAGMIEIAYYIVTFFWVRYMCWNYIPSNVAIRKTVFMATIQSPVMPKNRKHYKVLAVIRLFFRVAKIKHIKKCHMYKCS